MRYKIRPNQTEYIQNNLYVPYYLVFCSLFFKRRKKKKKGKIPTVIHCRTNEPNIFSKYRIIKSINGKLLEWRESEPKKEQQSKDWKIKIRNDSYFRGRILKSDILSHKILSFHNSTSTSKSTCSNNSRCLKEKKKP